MAQKIGSGITCVTYACGNKIVLGRKNLDVAVMGAGQVYELPGSRNAVWMTTSRGGLLAVGWPGVIQIWNISVPPFSLLHTIQDPELEEQEMGFLQERYLLVANNKEIKVFRVGDGGLERIITSDFPILHLSVSSSNAVVASASTNVFLFSMRGNAQKIPVDSGITGVQYYGDNTVIVSSHTRIMAVSKNGMLWNRDDCCVIKGLAVSPQKKLVVAGGEDLWFHNAQTGGVYAVVAGIKAQKIAISPNGTRLVFINDREEAFVWNIRDILGGK